ncbi:MAG: FeoA family protein [Chitinophagaceae bacterium]
MRKKITQMQEGHIGKIVEIQDSEIKLHLLEMGCIEGEYIEIKKCSVLGSPISIKIGNYILSLRTQEAKYIIVKQLNVSRETFSKSP